MEEMNRKSAPDTNAISGTPIRVIGAIMFLVALCVGGNLYDGFGLLIGAVVGLINGVFLFSFSTIVDAAHKYLKER